MASGLLSSAVPAAAANLAVYTVPANTTATFNVLAVNRGGNMATVRVAITSEAGNMPLDKDWVEYGAVLAGNGGVLERFGLVAGAGEKVVVWASEATVSFRINGFEGEAS